MPSAYFWNLLTAVAYPRANAVTDQIGVAKLQQNQTPQHDDVVLT